MHRALVAYLVSRHDNASEGVANQVWVLFEHHRHQLVDLSTPQCPRSPFNFRTFALLDHNTFAADVKLYRACCTCSNAGVVIRHTKLIRALWHRLSLGSRHLVLQYNTSGTSWLVFSSWKMPMTVFSDMGNMVMSFGRVFKSASTSRICITCPIMHHSLGQKKRHRTLSP